MTEKPVKKPQPVPKLSRVDRMFAASALALTLLAAGVVAAVLVLPSASASSSDLEINDVFPVIDRAKSTDETVVFVFEIPITNRGSSPADDVHLRAYAKRLAGIVEVRGDVSYDRIEARKTVTRTLTMALPVGYSYSILLRIEMQQFQIMEGSGSVDLRISGGSSGGGAGSGAGASFDKSGLNQPSYASAAGMDAGVGAVGAVLFLLLMLLLGWGAYRLSKKKQASSAAPPAQVQIGPDGYYPRS